MDDGIQRELQGFLADPTEAGALGALRTSARAQDPCPAVLRWGLSIARWDTLCHDLQLALARSVALLPALDLTFHELVTATLGPLTRRVAVFRRADLQLSLIPAGRVELGFAFQPTPRMRREAAQAIYPAFEQDRSEAGRTFLLRSASGIRPPRACDVEPFLIARDPQTSPTLSAGMRHPSVDEWEWAASGGARTLFRWGDDWGAGSPRDPSEFDEHLRANAFGLRGLPHDPDVPEFGADADDALDAHNALPGILGWLPLASAYGSPLVVEGESRDLLDDVRYRGVLPLELPAPQQPRVSD